MIRKSTSKKSTAIKICGITKTSQARIISQFKINALGVIGVKNSPRFVPEEECIKIFKEVEKVSTSIQRVLVIANEKFESIKSISNRLNPPSVLQLHGDESVDYCRELKKEFPTIKLWKAFRLKSLNDLENISQYDKNIDAILLDAWDDKCLGGTGNRIPIELLIDKSFKSPWILAGGISAEIIPEIFSKLKPDGIDASSRLEISPGIKDIKKVRSLVQVIRENN
ncbi:phosphoribosylanthranilate isomerase [Prochlorococcus marinus]|uniref:N-(5'-phosphoribosyl)anthranilate isomerase n=1 Tax=Prochlorococcus marinus XMU1408 TaxID=2213228 RepID=A0A318R3D4_PROMR|nr:phosphoribosylanthranilate isomerase [Prochlorococcus marinus]MBW3041563.1 phosphoribosylanthranilate isomerase [Prochlorococcus marinus str. XMU1408]PYE02720.1 phosphoribosylanthranilate isomerase [Prochlorococcus marinus XMU1408]